MVFLTISKEYVVRFPKRVGDPNYTWSQPNKKQICFQITERRAEEIKQLVGRHFTSSTKSPSSSSVSSLYSYIHTCIHASDKMRQNQKLNNLLYYIYSPQDPDIFNMSFWTIYLTRSLIWLSYFGSLKSLKVPKCDPLLGALWVPTSSFGVWTLRFWFSSWSPRLK